MGSSLANSLVSKPSTNIVTFPLAHALHCFYFNVMLKVNNFFVFSNLKIVFMFVKKNSLKWYKRI